MKALNALVVVMGVLIVAGLVLVAYGMAKRLGGPGGLERAARPADSPPAAFGDLDLTLPPGSEVVDMVVADRRLVLRVETREGGQRLYVLDPSTGALIGTIALNPAP